MTDKIEEIIVGTFNHLVTTSKKDKDNYCVHDDTDGCFDSIEEIQESTRRIVKLARAAERTRTIEEVLELMKGMLSGQEIDNGHDCYEHFCDYCENNIKDGVLEDVVAKLEAMREAQ